MKAEVEALERMSRALQKVAAEMKWAVRIFAASNLRLTEARRLREAQAANANGANLDIQVVTHSDGCTRVHVRELGGWA